MKRVLRAVVLLLLGRERQKFGVYFNIYQWSRVYFASLASWIMRYIEYRFKVDISIRAEIGRNVVFPHPFGIVIGRGVVIGDNVKIFQHVTLGGARIGDATANRFPKIGAGVTIFAGAVVVGDVRIGANSVIGANAVVVSDIPDGVVCGGVPAKVIKRCDCASV